MLVEKFGQYKSVFVILIFLVVISAQFIWPYRKDAKAVLVNMAYNLVLGFCNSLLGFLVFNHIWTMIFQKHLFAGFALLDISRLPIAAQIILSVIVLDGLACVWHIANHRSRLLWRWHLVHHTDAVYDASTAYRFHPIEVAISFIVRAATVVIFGMPVLGVLVFEICYVTLNTCEHANLLLPQRFDKIVSLILVTPNYHRRHHRLGKLDYDTNFATIFSFWDRLFGTRNLRCDVDELAVGFKNSN